MFEIVLKGFLVFAAMIIAIGSQNAFVLKQALIKNHILSVCLLCGFCDLLLVSLGVFGFGAIVNQSELILTALIIFGVFFLTGYAIKCFYDAYQNQYEFNLGNQNTYKARNKTLLATLGVTAFNPHVYLDTLVIIGGIGATYQGSEKWFFVVGASLASFTWFLLLGFGVRILIPLFKKKNTWRVLDSLIGLIMLYIAFDLTSML